MRRTVIASVVISTLFAVTGPIERAAAQIISATERPSYEILALSVRTAGLPRGTVEVFVTARDERGIGWVDIDCAGERHVVQGDEQAVVNALVRCTPQENSLPRVRATAFSRDGNASGKSVIVPMDGAHAVAASKVPVGRVTRRLADRDYPQRVGAFDDYAANLVPVALDGIPWWKKWVKSPSRKPFDFASHCGASITHVAPDGQALRCWLELHPDVRKNIVWHEYVSPVPLLMKAHANPRGLVDETIPYDKWTEDMKIWLDVSVYWAHSYMAGGAEVFNGQYLPDVPPSLITYKDDEGAHAILTRDDVWKLYLGTIAHSLALELGNFVPWSIVSYSEPDLEILFHSDLLVQGLKFTQGNRTFLGYIPKAVIPAPPTGTFEFLINQDLIRPTAYATVGSFIKWGRADLHLVHMTPVNGVCWPGTALCNELFYSYRGGAPLARLLEGTMHPTDADWGPSGFVPGCYGMAELFQHTLRMLNIPVEGETAWHSPTNNPHSTELGDAEHKAPFFWTLGRTMSHGDDVYNWAGLSIPPHPGEWMMISMDTYEDWFLGDDVLDGPWSVGRQATYEVPLQSLSNMLLQMYCVDQASGASHADGTIAAFFKVPQLNASYYDVAQLEAMNLWDKLKVKAATLGFCQ